MSDINVKRAERRRLEELGKVKSAALLRRDSEERLRMAVRVAVENGVPVSDVADAAGVNRVTVYRWGWRDAETPPG